MSLVRNKPCEVGRAAGEMIARFADQAEAEMMSDGDFTLPRCKSCAFRLGTFPNGCMMTVADALKCVMEAKPFYCHERKKDWPIERLCSGWTAARIAVRGKPPLLTPWKFSHEYAEEGAE